MQMRITTTAALALSLFTGCAAQPPTGDIDALHTMFEDVYAHSQRVDDSIQTTLYSIADGDPLTRASSPVAPETPIEDQLLGANRALFLAWRSASSAYLPEQCFPRHHNRCLSNSCGADLDCRASMMNDCWEFAGHVCGCNEDGWLCDQP